MEIDKHKMDVKTSQLRGNINLGPGPGLSGMGSSSMSRPMGMDMDAGERGLPLGGDCFWGWGEGQTQACGCRHACCSKGRCVGGGGVSLRQVFGTRSARSWGCRWQ